MNETTSYRNILATGFAMFSMFFGAGNVVFPLAVGLFTEDKSPFAAIGLLITAVGVPFVGLIAISLFHGDYKPFFGRIGNWGGFLIAFLIMALIGPFGALPRCIALSHSTLSVFIPGIHVWTFSFLSCLLIFFLTWKKNRIVDVIGFFLTPLLLFSLAVIVIKGIFFSEVVIQSSDLTTVKAFFHGLLEGYQTMDLLGAFFFSSVIISCFEPSAEKAPLSQSETLSLLMRASLVGASLLSLVYVGFSFLAAFQKDALAEASKDLILAYVALEVLGPWAGIFASVAVALACLTTAIALSSVFAEFIHNDISKGKINYPVSLFITLFIAFFMSTLEFNQIISLLAPILETLYPSLIALSLLNILYKLYNFPYVKAPFYAILTLSILDKIFW